MPGELAALSMGGNILSSILQEIDGYGQRSKGNSILGDLQKRRNAGEFMYQTPSEIMSSLDLARNQFLDTKLPGQDVAENKLEANTSQAVRMAQAYGQSPADIMATITNVNANENNAFNDLTTSASNRQLMDLQNYQEALGTSADYKDKEFQYNTWMPYMMDTQYGQQLVGAGNQNKYGGLETLNSALAVGAENEDLSSLFSKLFDKGGMSDAAKIAKGAGKKV